MKIIEALKKIKDLQRKASDLREKIAKHCVKMDYEADHYENQGEKVSGWLQAHKDILSEVEQLRERVAKTNIETDVTIELQGRSITKSIHSWITRRRDLVDLDRMAWGALGDKGLKDQNVQGSSGNIVHVKVVRFYNPEERDKKVDAFSSEKSEIDGSLEIVNATTDLL